MLTCCECTRSVHYRCTQLPAYQIQAFLEKRIKRHFHCSNCILVPEELQRIVNPISKEQQEINRLKREIKRCENITKISEENTKLTRKIVQEQLAKFNEKGLENYIDKKFKDLTENLSDSIKNQQHSSQKSYSEILKEDITRTDLHTIIRVAKIEEKKEEKDHLQRKNNVIIYGAQEDELEKEEERTNVDTSFVDNLLKDVLYKAKTSYVGRIGKKTEGKSRPLKVAFKTEEEKRKLFSNLKAMKGVDKYKGISISDDYTIAERQMIKEWAEKAKNKNQEEPADSSFIWRVRGNPKSGLTLRKLVKKGPSSPDQ